mmetsp:Transcript_47380/g.107402  ORF Transcript_47380/g.107402 Transcript_47380/m.107402 type:complete len:249 (+) Transcript_47380:940-1686(+)
MPAASWAPTSSTTCSASRCPATRRCLSSSPSNVKALPKESESWSEVKNRERASSQPGKKALPRDLQRHEAPSTNAGLTDRPPKNGPSSPPPLSPLSPPPWPNPRTSFALHTRAEAGPLTSHTWARAWARPAGSFGAPAAAPGSGEVRASNKHARGGKSDSDEPAVRRPGRSSSCPLPARRRPSSSSSSSKRGDLNPSADPSAPGSSSPMAPPRLKTSAALGRNAESQRASRASAIQAARSHTLFRARL